MLKIMLLEYNILIAFDFMKIIGTAATDFNDGGILLTTFRDETLTIKLKLW